MFSQSSLKFFTKKNKILYNNFKKKPNFNKFLDLIKKGQLPRPHYGLGMLLAAKQAKELGYKKIKILELGCWNFEGLIDIENYSNDIGSILDIDIEIFGFTLKDGLPNYKENKYDRLYRWGSGDYKFNKDANFKKLKKSKIYFGDVKKTIKKFFKDNIKSFPNSPIGFVCFDLDYYTSTKNGLNLFKLNPVNYLPRTNIYFDDHSFGSFDEGESRAIKEFNKVSIYKISDICELGEQLSIYFNKWIFLGKRIKVINYYNHPEFNKRIEQLF